MKKRYLLVLFLLLFILSISFKISTKEAFWLSSEDEKIYIKKAKQGDTNATMKLFTYYYYSLQDTNKSIKLLRYASKQGNREIQFILSSYLLREYYPKEIYLEDKKNEGIYWLKESAKLKYKPAIKKLKNIYANHF